MEIKDIKERAELIWQLNRVGDYSTHKELWDAYYKFEELVKVKKTITTEFEVIS